MAYNSGNFSLFSQTGFTVSTQVYGELLKPIIFPPAGVQYTNVYTSYLAPSVTAAGLASGSSFSALSISLTQNALNTTIPNAYSLFIQPPSISSGSLKTVYSLFVSNPTNTGGAGQQLYTAYLGGPTGIGTTTPQNKLDVLGSVAVGTYAGNIKTRDNNSMIVSGAVGVGTPSPQYPLDIQGIANTLRVLAPETTLNNQKTVLSQGYAEAGNTGGLVATNIPISTSNTLSFDTAASVSTSSKGFSGGVFDGRYVYAVPFNNGAYYGQITRFDSFSSFSSSSSYSVFNTATLNSNSVGFSAANFDGRYIYFMSYNNGSAFISQITRFDTTVSFASAASYTLFQVTGNVTGDKGGYSSSVFDGRYVYFIAEGTGTTFFGTILQYDTTSSFTSASSYSVFDTSLVDTRSKGFSGGAFDGQYVYFVPYLQNTGSASSIVMQYNTTIPFSISTSYTSFDLSLVNSASRGFNGAIFDGRFLYFCNTNFNFLTMYDTQAPFTSSASYNVFNTGVSNIMGGLFDGRYLYLVGPSLITRYDATLPFSNSTSYASLAINNTGSVGASFDGNYAYFFSGASSSGVITQMIAYPGPPATAQSIGYSIGNFNITGNLSLLVNLATTATSGSAAACPTQCAGFLWVNVNGTQQRIAFF